MSVERAELVTLGGDRGRTDGTDGMRRMGRMGRPDRTLICVPHAGGSAAAFHAWHRVFGPRGTAVLAVHWERRDGSEHRSSIEARAASLAAAARELQGPWILLGHSLGALIVAEAVRQLESSPGPLPERAVLCASTPPGTPRTFPPDVLQASDARMAAYVRRLGGTDERILTDAEFGPRLLAALRADLDLIERYAPDFTRPLATPVSVYGATADRDVPVQSLEGWRRWAPEARVRVFDGGHFFPHEDPAAICRAVTADCAPGEPDRSLR
ncbi:thioesterase [Streptomyces rectiverticillatus]|uniref:thioesterase II family protein n=1 Tax=Streptomyces rectiverticillatus TaxID=173860 RepID=UPI0015C37F86|nr:alpha/beta fold hydrolase [Streptomyces rectiverticillatus]QLE70437.1 thioesterase [Streptomyces rectiverticillatus]